MSDKEPEYSETDEELFEHYRIVADSGQEPLRIDKFLMDRIPNTSRTKLQDAANEGNIRVNDQKVKANYKVKPNDEISIVLPYPKREIELIPEDIPLDILYEDEHMIILNKSANMVVHPGYGNYTGTMVNALIHHFDNLPEAKDGIPGRPGLVHRLDKNTTGVMVIAKTEKALTNLSLQFFERTIDRRYIALAWGDIEEDGMIEGHIGRSLKNRKVMSVFPEGEHGKEARTRYKILERLTYVTLVECKLETGRTHQIRAHFQHINHPLFNDPEYGGNKILKGTQFSKYKQFVVNNFDLLPRQALHARKLELAHPFTGERMNFESELPEDFAVVLNRWRKYISRR
ncbi:MAG: RluA family pseudouridine synthase [Flavobacteriales bacterium]|nr:RluA family pseudouridine synthase [Flavobacteriales bacterium]